MIERKIEISKDNVTKSIDENLISIYMNMGWKKVEPKKEVTEEVKSKGILTKKNSKGF